MNIQQALIIVLTSTLFVCSAVGVDLHSPEALDFLDEAMKAR